MQLRIEGGTALARGFGRGETLFSNYMVVNGTAAKVTTTVSDGFMVFKARGERQQWLETRTNVNPRPKLFPSLKTAMTAL